MADPQGTVSDEHRDRTRDINLVRIPRRFRAPLSAISQRIAFAIALIVFVGIVVVTLRSGYVDVAGDSISFLDAVYYASVTVTTTGYGDITAISDGARLATVFLITPARIIFLILVVGTTVEVLTDQSRQLLLTRRWRKRVNNHFVICGFGATGQSAAADLVQRGVNPAEIVAVDLSAEAIVQANERGFVGIHGDATQNAVLDQAGIALARSVVVTPNRDDTAVLVTLTVRERNPHAHIVAGGREQENLHLLRQGGADQVIDATAAVGRMLGLATYAPSTVRVLDDLLDAGAGLELIEIAPDVSGDEPGLPHGATLVAIIRADRRLSPDELETAAIEATDRLVVLRESSNDPGR